MSEAQANIDGDFGGRWVRAQPALSVYISAAIPNFHDAQDVLQKVAIVAFSKWSQFDPDHMDFFAWTVAIARFEILRFRRDRARDRFVFDEPTLTRLGAVQESLKPELEERLIALQHCLEKTQPRARKLLTLRYSENLKPAQIAERLSAGVKTINVTLSRIRKALRECVDRRLRMEGQR